MNFLANLRIANKFLFLLILVTLALCGVGFTGYYYISSGSEAMEDMYSDRLLPIELLNENRAHARAIQMDIFHLMITTDPARNNQLKSDIAERVKQSDQNMKEYEKTKLDPEETKILKSLHENLDKYRASRQKVLDLAFQNKNAEAYQAYLNEVEVFAEKYNHNLIELAKYNIKTQANFITKSISRKRFPIGFSLVSLSGPCFSAS